MTAVDKAWCEWLEQVDGHDLEGTEKEPFFAGYAAGRASRDDLRRGVSRAMWIWHDSHGQDPLCADNMFRKLQEIANQDEEGK